MQAHACKSVRKKDTKRMMRSKRKRKMKYYECSQWSDVCKNSGPQCSDNNCPKNQN